MVALRRIGFKYDFDTLLTTREAWRSPQTERHRNYLLQTKYVARLPRGF
jgi:hypothetical protein